MLQTSGAIDENKFAHNFEVDFDTGIFPVKIITSKNTDTNPKPDYKAMKANPKDDLEDEPFPF